MVPAEEKIARTWHCAFRVDASLDIGTGHVIRCLTLAKALREAGHDCTFICRKHRGNAIEAIRRQGFEVIELPSTESYYLPQDEEQTHHAAWLGVDWQTDVSETMEACKSHQKPDWLIIDHYALDERWQKFVHIHCGRILVIDDLADRPHHAEILLDQNYYPDMAQRYDKLVSTKCRLLIGPEYTLLREEFTRLTDIEPRDGNIESVLVFFGGVDATGETLKTLQAIGDSDVHIKVIVGNSNPQKDEIEEFCSSRGHIDCLRDVDNMAELMLESDLAIGAGGTTTWERCYTGLPAIVISLADNQRAVNHAMQGIGACIDLGSTSVAADRIRYAFEELKSSPGQVMEMSKSALSMMHDHRGCAGVIEAMESFDD